MYSSPHHRSSTEVGEAIFTPKREWFNDVVTSLSYGRDFDENTVVFGGANSRSRVLPVLAKSSRHAIIPVSSPSHVNSCVYLSLKIILKFDEMLRNLIRKYQGSSFLSFSLTVIACCCSGCRSCRPSARKLHLLHRRFIPVQDHQDGLTLV